MAEQNHAAVQSIVRAVQHSETAQVNVDSLARLLQPFLRPPTATVRELLLANNRAIIKQLSRSNIHLVSHNGQDFLYRPVTQSSAAPSTATVAAPSAPPRRNDHNNNGNGGGNGFNNHHHQPLQQHQQQHTNGYRSNQYSNNQHNNNNLHHNNPNDNDRRRNGIRNDNNNNNNNRNNDNRPRRANRSSRTNGGGDGDGEDGSAGPSETERSVVNMWLIALHVAIAASECQPGRQSRQDPAELQRKVAMSIDFLDRCGRRMRRLDENSGGNYGDNSAIAHFHRLPPPLSHFLPLFDQSATSYYSSSSSTPSASSSSSSANPFAALQDGLGETGTDDNNGNSNNNDDDNDNDNEDGANSHRVVFPTSWQSERDVSETFIFSQPYLVAALDLHSGNGNGNGNGRPNGKKMLLLKQALFAAAHESARFDYAQYKLYLFVLLLELRADLLVFEAKVFASLRPRANWQAAADSAADGYDDINKAALVLDGLYAHSEQLRELNMAEERKKYDGDDLEELVRGMHSGQETIERKHNEILQAIEQRQQFLQEKLSPMWADRDQVKRKMGEERWRQNPTPKRDYAEARAEWEEELRSLERAKVDLEMMAFQPTVHIPDN